MCMCLVHSLLIPFHSCNPFLFLANPIFFYQSQVPKLTANYSNALGNVPSISNKNQFVNYFPTQVHAQYRMQDKNTYTVFVLSTWKASTWYTAKIWSN